MSAGIRIYNANSQVLIDSNYKNIALNKVIDLTGVTNTNYELGDKSVVIVEELPAIGSVMSRVRLGYNNGYRAYVSNIGKIAQKLFVFGEPEQLPKGPAGFIIYKNGTSEVAFDSRLKYLQIIGEISNDMPINPDKKYGIIRRVPSGDNHYSQHTGTSNGRYYYVEQIWHESYCIDNGKIRIFNHYTRNINSWFGDRPIPNISIKYDIPFKPLLVDLTQVYGE